MPRVEKTFHRFSCFSFTVAGVRYAGMPDDESMLLERLRSGDGEAFETLVRTRTPAMLRLARRFLRSEDDACDAVQDAFISAFRSMHQFAEEAKLSTWLRRIVINACLMKLRSLRRHPEEDIERYLPTFLEDGHQAVPASSWGESAHEALERSEMRTFVRSSIECLPETYRVVLLLHDIEEMTTEETADTLGITANAVKIRLHRARQALRTLLDPQMKERGC